MKDCCKISRGKSNKSTVRKTEGSNDNNMNRMSRLAEVLSKVALLSVHIAAGSMTSKLMHTIASRLRQITGAMALRGEKLIGWLETNRIQYKT